MSNQHNETEFEKIMQEVEAEDKQGLLEQEIFTYETLKKMNPSSMLKAGCHSFDSSTLVSYCDIDRPNRHVLGKNWKSI